MPAAKNASKELTKAELDKLGVREGAWFYGDVVRALNSNLGWVYSRFKRPKREHCIMGATSELMNNFVRRIQRFNYNRKSVRIPGRKGMETIPTSELFFPAFHPEFLSDFADAARLMLLGDHKPKVDEAINNLEAGKGYAYHPTHSEVFTGVNRFKWALHMAQLMHLRLAIRTIALEMGLDVEDWHKRMIAADRRIAFRTVASRRDRVYHEAWPVFINALEYFDPATNPHPLVKKPFDLTS